jgi:serine/threonine protein kinase
VGVERWGRYSLAWPNGFGGAEHESTWARLLVPPCVGSTLSASDASRGWTGPEGDRYSYYVVDRARFVSGGAGVIFKAQLATDRLDMERGSIVAVKQFAGGLADDRFDKLLERSTALCAVNHPNLARLLEVFAGPPFSKRPDLQPASSKYCCHAWIKGESLATRAPTCSVDDVVSWASDLSSGLDFLHNHEQGSFAHRDIHPENIVITPSGVAVLIDFDMILIDRGQGTQTAMLLPGTRFTPADRSPGIKGAQRDDRWSLARTLLYCLAQDPEAALHLDEATQIASKRSLDSGQSAAGIVKILRSVVDGRDLHSAQSMAVRLSQAAGASRLPLNRSSARRSFSLAPMRHTFSRMGRMSNQGRRRSIVGILGILGIGLLTLAALLGYAIASPTSAPKQASISFKSYETPSGLWVTQHWTLGGVRNDLLLGTVTLQDVVHHRVTTDYQESIAPSITRKIFSSEFLPPIVTIVNQDPTFRLRVALSPYSKPEVCSFQFFVRPSESPQKRLDQLESVEQQFDPPSRQALLLTSFALAPKSVTLRSGVVFAVTTVGILSNGRQAPPSALYAIQWSTSSGRIARVKHGVITAEQPGSAEISAWQGSKRIRIHVRVVSSGATTTLKRQGGSTTSTSNSIPSTSNSIPSTSNSMPTTSSTPRTTMPTTSTSLRRTSTTTTTMPSTPPPVQPVVTPETTGGLTHTWTSYADAGGTKGPSISAYTTVEVSCRVQGFKVADGNTWWYLIASSPWNSAYYASADAFYNNGQTSGSLQGTPFVDLSVPLCS